MFRYIFYIIVKWICFYLYQYLESGHNWNWEKIKTKEDLYYTIWMLIALPITEMIILALPIYLALRQRGWFMFSILSLTFVLEFMIGWYATNQQFSIWMIVKILMSISLFLLFYRKTIW